MDFLKSAVAAVGSVKGPPFPYTFADQVTLDHSIWKLFNGVKRVGTEHDLMSRLRLTGSARRISLTAVSSHSMYPRINHGYHWQGMQFANYAL